MQLSCLLLHTSFITSNAFQYVLDLRKLFHFNISSKLTIIGIRDTVFNFL